MLTKTKADFQFGLLVPAWAAADGLGQITLLVMPFVIGALVTELGFGLADAGLVLTIEMGTLSIVAMVISPLMGNLSRSKLAVTGALIAVLGNSLSIYAQSFGQIATCRAIAGLGYGLALASGNAAISNSENPERVYERKMVLFGLTQLVIMVAAPFTLRYLGIKGLFAGLAVLSLVLIPLVIKLPKYKAISANADLPESQDRDSQLNLPIIATVAIVAALAVYSVREALAWAFIERVGSRLSMSGEVVGVLVGVGAFIGLVGPLLATRARGRFGIAGPAMAGTVLSGLLTYTIVTATSQFQYGAILVMWPLAYYFTVPLLMGLAANVDQKGRVVAACGGSLLLAYAAGPVVAGLLSENFGPDAMGYFTLIAIVISAALVAITAMDAKKSRDSRSTAPE